MGFFKTHYLTLTKLKDLIVSDMSVIKTEDTEFKVSLENHDKVIVKYFADWCGNCRLFAPKYKRLSNDARFEAVTFLEVNAEENPEARKAGEVNSLPYFATFSKGQLIDGKATSKEDVVVEMIENLTKGA